MWRPCALYSYLTEPTLLYAYWRRRISSILSYSKVVLLYYTKFYKISNLRREAVGRLVSSYQTSTVRILILYPGTAM